MSLPGRILYQLREWRAMGWPAARAHAFLRPRILRAPPTDPLDDRRCEIHAMTSGHDCLNLAWALKSFYFCSGRRYALCIHDDGTLPPEAGGHFRRLFPGCRIVRRKEADARMEAELKAFPRLAEFRKNNVFGPRVADFSAYLEGDRMLLLDSDVLFFAAPAEILRRIEDLEYGRNTFNLDFGNGYVLTREQVRAACGLDLVERYNTGLSLHHRASLDPAWFEEFLGIPGLREGFPWYIEQQLFALCASRQGADPLPKEYDVRVPADPVSLVSHFIKPIRNDMLRIGMPRLARIGILERKTLVP